MLSRIILVLLLPSALAFPNPRTAAIAGRQEVDIYGCECQRVNGTEDNHWTKQPAHEIQELCRQGYGHDHVCKDDEYGVLCIGSEDYSSCQCLVQSAVDWETWIEETHWSLVGPGLSSLYPYTPLPFLSLRT